MSTNFELTAESRTKQGTRDSRRMRRAGRVPAVLYGGGKATAHLSLDHDKVMHNLENEAFHAAILTVKTGKGSEQAILRDVQMHPHRPRILHVDLQRVDAKQTLHIKVPIHFVGGDDCPGVKLQSGIVSHQMTEVDIACLPGNLPEYLEADVSALNLHESVHLSDLKLPEGVEITTFGHGGDDLAVATIVAVRGSVEEEETEAVAESAEGEAAAAVEATEGSGEKSD